MEKLQFSKMTGKLQGIPATCTDTTSNKFCQKMQCSDAVCKDCYSEAMLNGLRKNCKPRWKKHLEILSTEMVEQQLPKTTARQARFQAHGELTNVQNARNLLAIARKNPSTIFAFFTKRYRLVQQAIAKDGKPANVILIYSSPKLDTQSDLPRHFDKVFTVYTDKERNDYICKGKKCLDCLACYRKKGPVHISELVRR